MTRQVLVTGASRGIGRHVALALAAKGFGIAVHYKARKDAALETAKEIEALGVSARLISFDVADREAAAAALEADIEEHGAYYGIVCNAGIHADNAFPALTGEEWDSVLRTNLDGFYNVLHPAIMPMVRTRKGGRIVVMSSVSGLMGNRGQVNYSAAKGGLIAASKALAVELAKRRITVNCVAPGIIETEMTEEVEVDRVMDMIPAQRFGKPEEVASLVAYLFSDEAGYITRQVISVNGGMF
ncbi:3-oxoacyl-ACP reductase FabG [Tepidicaulis sp. LMO-SS28]|uniref:3-oxoacyl-ACP reductase FabG n=1 Tax=Tepidicaulis sp. LMO-SS28 TaxID=3447455 RepID=UPI003EE25C00